MSFQPDELQQKAIDTCCNIENRIVAVTGKAGTGKTTIMRLVYEQLTEQGLRVVMCAPTGKASKRISQATGLQAMTIHRLLEYPYPGERDEKTGKTYQSGFPKRCRANPLDCDVVLCDEYAMVTQEVHRNLLDALPKHAVLRTFGDINQLQPVEESKALQAEPSAFKVLLEKFVGVTLMSIHRQGEGSGITSAGGNILLGRMPQRRDDFTIKVTEQPVLELLDYIRMRAATDNVLFNDVDNQIICLQFPSWVGTYKLNAALQLHFRPEADGWINLPRHKWEEKTPVRVRVGDKVIFTKNYYATEFTPDYEVFNGETGIITKVYPDTEEFDVDLGDRTLTVPPVYQMKGRNGFYDADPRKDIQLAYALTTHKCQGSEYKNIVYVMNKSAIWVQSRKNFYTAITRARENAHLICDSKSLSYSLWKTGEESPKEKKAV